MYLLAFFQVSAYFQSGLAAKTKENWAEGNYVQTGGWKQPFDLFDLTWLFSYEKLKLNVKVLQFKSDLDEFMSAFEPFAHISFEFHFRHYSSCISYDLIVLVFQSAAFLTLSFYDRILIVEEFLFKIVICHIILNL